MTTWHTIKGYLAGALALIACPCHLPITFPLLLGLTAGTALGAWLEGSFGLVFGFFTIIFIGGLGLSMLWLGKEKEGARPSPRSKGRRSKPIAKTSPPGAPVELTLVTSSACSSCEKAQEIWAQVGLERPLNLAIVDINSPEGRALAAQHNIFATPTTLVDGKVAVRGIPSLKKARQVLGG